MVCLRDFGIIYIMVKIDPDKLREYVRNHPEATARQIGAHFNRSRRTISFAVHYYKIPFTAKRKGTPIIKAEELREYVSRHPHATQRQIAAHFHRDQSSISTALKRSNIRECCLNSYNDHFIDMNSSIKHSG
jgi:IS30 family transposase